MRFLLILALAAGGLAGVAPSVRPPARRGEHALCQNLLALERAARWTADSASALVRAVDAVVLVRAVAEAQATSVALGDSALVRWARPKRHWYSRRPPGAVAFRVLEVLAAPPRDTALRPAGRLVLAGLLTRDHDHYTDRDAYYSEAPVPRREGRGAPVCDAPLGYRAGRDYLLLLDREPATGRYTPYGRVYDPTNERVRGPNDPWLRWVRAALRTASR